MIKDLSQHNLNQACADESSAGPLRRGDLPTGRQRRKTCLHPHLGGHLFIFGQFLVEFFIGFFGGPLKKNNLTFLVGMPVLVGALRWFILPRLPSNVDHAANDLRVLNKPPKSCLGLIQWVLTNVPTFLFRCYCSFIQSFQLQSSKVSGNCNIAIWC